MAVKWVTCPVGYLTAYLFALMVEMSAENLDDPVVARKVEKSVALWN